ncbi:MAG: lipase family protein [Pseudomonadota bacterium]
MSTYFSAKELLLPPTERAAFSDRQAYVCAELSRLAYFKFEGGHIIDQVLGVAKQFVGDDVRYKILEKELKNLLTGSPSSQAEGEKALGEILKAARFNLKTTFSTQGTQAFLCTKIVRLESGAEKVLAFLVFRGTEPKDFRDIKTDVSAGLETIDLDGDLVEFHTGYLNAFRLVKDDIYSAIKNIKYDQLFITGHSLGGALAVVATRILASSVNGACYTFGAPPVGSVTVQNKLKTPVYQIINKVDIVPRLPNPWLATGVGALIRLFKYLAKLFTVTERLLASGTWDERIETYIDVMTKYRHPGYRSYLIGSSSAARLRFNVDSFDLFSWWLALMWKRRIFMFRTMASDHAIDEYVEKLKQHASKRQ